MTLQDVWNLLNEILRADPNREIDKKMRAINEGYLHFAKRMLNVGNYLPELLSSAYGIDTVLAQNYVELPSDFLGLHTIFFKNNSSYNIADASQIKDFDYLVEQANSRFIDITDLGIPSIFSIKEPNLYFDKHWDEAITDGIKLLYHKMPASLLAYDTIELSGVTGAFQVGEIINQTTTDSYAYIRSISIDGTDVTLTVWTSTRSGTFFDTYDVTGSESSATGTQSGDMTEKPQVLEISSKYKTELANACALKYLYFDDDIEAIAKQETFESELKDIKTINKYDADFSIGFSI